MFGKNHEERIEFLLEAIKNKLIDIGVDAKFIVDFIKANEELNTIQIEFKNITTGDVSMDGNFTLTPLTPLLATPVEKDGSGNVFQFDPTKLVYSVKDPTIVSFAENADGTALFTPLAVGSTSVGLVDTATGAQVVVTATVTQGTLPNTLDITWSAPPVAAVAKRV